MDEDTLKQAENIIIQGLTALDTFEKSGNRLGFIAVLDQINTYNNKRKHDNKKHILGE